jgi:hypothetical protein
MTATEFLEVRAAVVSVIKQDTTSTKITAIAEGLMERGWIDVDAIKASLAAVEAGTGGDES